MKEAIRFVSQCGLESAKSLMRMGSGVCKLNDGEFHTDQLKEIVDAYDFVERQGGIDLLKAMEKSNRISGNIDVADNLKEAIALVEEVESLKEVS